MQLFCLPMTSFHQSVIYYSSPYRTHPKQHPFPQGRLFSNENLTDHRKPTNINFNCHKPITASKCRHRCNSTTPPTCLTAWPTSWVSETPPHPHSNQPFTCKLSSSWTLPAIASRSSSLQIVYAKTCFYRKSMRFCVITDTGCLIFMRYRVQKKKKKNTRRVTIYNCYTW